MSKYTQRAIIQSFMNLIQSKSFDKITVREIIEKADVNRNTFYYHYQDIYDLLDSIFKIEAERFRHDTVIDRSFLEAYRHAADVLQANRSAIIHIYNSAGQEELVRFLNGAAVHFVRRFVEMDARNTKLSKRGKEFIIYFYSYSMLGVVMHWIECRMPVYREQVLELFAQSYEATVGDMIETYIVGHPEECR